ncbi:hypothetical protein E2C01_095745 [Portunus trituberculatus]|uniref:Uncharacterized protein n=1 Tax=Portunus trituberculatus TaxID=210409 RepID=A0A5B7K0Y7_PORTR|nr:hypothetical protein [Portunus trituberculatus]
MPPPAASYGRRIGEIALSLSLSMCFSTALLTSFIPSQHLSASIIRGNSFQFHRFLYLSLCVISLTIDLDEERDKAIA